MSDVTTDRDREAALFLQLLLGLQQAAMVALGKLMNPVSGRIERNLEAARNTIDTLSALEVRTRGNLGADEQRVLRRRNVRDSSGAVNHTMSVEASATPVSSRARWRTRIAQLSLLSSTPTSTNAGWSMPAATETMLMRIRRPSEAARCQAETEVIASAAVARYVNMATHENVQQRRCDSRSRRVYVNNTPIIARQMKACMP